MTTFIYANYLCKQTLDRASERSSNSPLKIILSLGLDINVHQQYSV